MEGKGRQGAALLGAVVGEMFEAWNVVGRAGGRTNAVPLCNLGGAPVYVCSPCFAPLPNGRFLLPSYFPLVLRAVASLEGVALSVDKNFKLISAGEVGQAPAAGGDTRR